MLTPKQSRFVDSFLDCGNGAKAAVTAGYSPRCAKEIAYETLTRPHVQAAIAARRGRAAREANITRQRVLDGLLAAISVAKVNMDPAAQIRGWSEIAKMLGFYAPETKRVVLSAEGDRRRAELEVLSDEELLEIANAP